MESRRYFIAPPHTKVCTQVDFSGLELVLDFGEEGRLDTSDPEVLRVLSVLVADGILEETDAPKPKKEADE